MLGPSLCSLTPFPPPPRETQTFVVSVPCLYRYIVVLLFYKTSDSEFFLWLLRGRTSIRYVAESVYCWFKHILFVYFVHRTTYKDIQ